MSIWNDRYREEGFAYGTQPNDFLKQHANRLVGPVLSLAEGEGRNAVYLASLALDVTGVDGSDVGLKKARELAAVRNVSITTVCSDMAGYDPGPKRFNAVVSISAHMPPATRKQIHASLAMWMNPGGIFLLEAYTPAQSTRSTGGPRDPAWCMSADMLREELQGFRIEFLQEIEREVIEGKYHTGMASVVQLIAIKS